jgi:hypothetical protein
LRRPLPQLGIVDGLRFAGYPVRNVLLHFGGEISKRNANIFFRRAKPDKLAGNFCVQAGSTEFEAKSRILIRDQIVRSVAGHSVQPKIDDNPAIVRPELRINEGRSAETWIAAPFIRAG